MGKGFLFGHSHLAYLRTMEGEIRRSDLIRLERHLSRLNIRILRNVYSEVDEVVVPIPLPVGVDYESVLEAVVGRIKRIAELIDAHTQNYEE